MRRLCRFFIILILACTVAGCSSEEGVTGTTFFWAVPKRQKYNVGETFIPRDEIIEVCTLSDKGEKQPVPLNQVKISLAKLPYDPEEELEEVTYDKGCTLGTPGSNIVVLEYESMSYNYPIDILELSTTGGSGIVIKWEGDK